MLDAMRITLDLIEESIPGIAIVDLLLPPEHGLGPEKIDPINKKQKLRNHL